jgi:methylenetetrahydrofolate reductase (NADPH)
MSRSVQPERLLTSAEHPSADGARAFEGVYAQLLEHPRLEVVPLSGIEDNVVEHVPLGATVTVTASPTRGLEPTLDLTERLAAAGYEVVPHLAARLVRDDGHVRQILDRLVEAGVTNVFVMAGDATQPAGVFEGAADLLQALAAHDHGLREIGITGYPEGHPFIDDGTLARAMLEKAELATYIVSQICFDAQITVEWIRRVRARGIQLPIHVGIPGAVGATKLLRTSTRIGIGDSLRFLRKQGSIVGKLLLPGAYKPEKLIRGLAPALVDPAGKVAGLHIFTFNELEATERWRRRQLERLGATGTRAAELERPLS